jgi:hypothetical protein
MKIKPSRFAIGFDIVDLKPRPNEGNPKDKETHKHQIVIMILNALVGVECVLEGMLLKPGGESKSIWKDLVAYLENLPSES